MQFSWTNETSEKIKIRYFLASRGVSHRMFSKLRYDDEGSIEIDGIKKFTSDFVLPNETIVINMPSEKPSETLASDFNKPDIIFENDNWLVVDKPAGITTVPGHADREHTLVNQVKGYLISSNAENQVPHVVTRLDRDTSGIVLMAKHKFAHAVLDAQLQKHEVKKYYQAIVRGILPKSHDIIDMPIGRVEGDFIQREVRDDGKPSITEYWVEKRNDKDNWTKVRVQLHTGRTHQIRVHFSSIGFPLVGDTLYGDQNLTRDIHFSHQALHAYQLSFFDPFESKNQLFESKLPKEFSFFQ